MVVTTDNFAADAFSHAINMSPGAISGIMVAILLGLAIGSPEAKQATLYWTGLLTSVLLLGWAAGGIVFGMVADRIGRTRTLMLTMLLYAAGTAACAAGLA